MNFKNLMMTAFSMLSSLLLAQSKQETIKLLDEETHFPISQAVYTYGDQRGTTQEDGVIQLNFENEIPLIISHPSYEKYVLNASLIKVAIENKVIYLKKNTINLFPIVRIGVKPQGPHPDEEMNIRYQERLEHDAAKILNQTPAFHSIRKGGNYGFDPVFRGFKYDQLNVVMNGAQSATAACPNRMDPPTSQMAPNMMDRIEILKGPHALRFGTGFGATINFIPTPLKFTDNPELYGRLSSGYEENGNLIRGESQLGVSSRNYDISLFASWSQGNDYTTGDDKEVQADFNRGSFGINMGFKINSNQELRLSTTYNRARDADFPALPMDLREDDTWMFNARHDVTFERNNLKSLKTTLYASFVDHLMDNRLKPLDPRKLNAENAAETYNYGGRTEALWKFKKSKLYAGLDLRIAGADGTRVREFIMGPMAGNTFYDNAWQDSRILQTGIFAEYQIKGDGLDYVISSRLDFNTGKANEPTDEFTQVHPETENTQVNPNISVGMIKKFNNLIQAGLWLARAQRSGSLTERYINFFPVGQDPYEMVGNPTLDAEVNYQADLNFKLRVTQNSTVNVDVFVAYLQDYISSVIDTTLSPRLPTSPGVRRYVNLEEVLKTGFEFSWSQKLFAGLSHHMGLAYTYGQDLDREEALPEISPLDIRYALFGNYFNERLRPEIVYRYVAKQSRISEEFGETETPSFELLDISIDYKVSDNLHINAGLKNVFNENYYEHLNRSVKGANEAIYAPGRNFFAGLNYTF